MSQAFRIRGRRTGLAGADKLQKEGLPVDVLAVDDGEKIDGFTAWVAKMGEKYPALTFAYSPQKACVSGKLYRVPGIPPRYIVDGKDVVRVRFAGDEGPTDVLEKAVGAALASGK